MTEIKNPPVSSESLPNTKTFSTSLKTISDLATYILLLSVLVFAVTFRDDAADSVRQSLHTIVFSVIPSLFPFLVIMPVLSSRLNIRSDAAEIFIIGILSGAQSAVAIICEKYRSGKTEKREAERLLALCGNFSPGFIIGALDGIFGDVRNGLYIFGVTLISGFIGGFFIYGKRDKKAEYNKNSKKAKTFVLLIKSINNAAHILLNVTAYIVFFGLVCKAAEVLLYSIGAKRNTVTIVALLLDVTNGCFSIGNCGSIAGFAVPAAISFSGFSVFAQIASISDEYGLRYDKYIISKLLQCLLTVVFVSINIILKRIFFFRL